MLGLTDGKSLIQTPPDDSPQHQHPGPPVLSLTFLWRPLKTTANAPCPTRSFLLYSKSPTVSIAAAATLSILNVAQKSN